VLVLSISCLKSTVVDHESRCTTCKQCLVFRMIEKRIHDIIVLNATRCNDVMSRLARPRNQIFSDWNFIRTLHLQNFPDSYRELFNEESRAAFFLLTS